MATIHTSSDVAEINIDVPCASCGYNLRGLAGDGRCPECGASVARSLEIHLNPIAPAQIFWARTVLAGLILWLLLTPACLCIALFVDSRFLWFQLVNVNFPGPKLWAVPMAQSQVGNASSPFGFVGTVLPLLVLMACFMITTPRTHRGGPERLFSLRRWTRWTAVVTSGGFFGVCVGFKPLDLSIMEVALMVFGAIATVELPGTVLLYLYLADVARKLELVETSVGIRICGLVAAAVMTASAVLLLLGLTPLSIGNPSLMVVGMWCAGAIAVGTAVVACGNLLWLAMALWPLAMVRLVRRHQ